MKFLFAVSLIFSTLVHFVNADDGEHNPCFNTRLGVEGERKCALCEPLIKALQAQEKSALCHVEQDQRLRAGDVSRACNRREGKFSDPNEVPADDCNQLVREFQEAIRALDACENRAMETCFKTIEL